mgnify:FL=1
MRLSRPPAIAATLMMAAGLAAYVRYRRDIGQIVTAVEAGGTLADTTAGPIEYAETGAGEPLLLIHGAGGGYDQGLLLARDFGDGFRIIAPSRFGYLRTPVPADASPPAQAAAHVALLDHLGVDRCIVVGVSAGGPSAIEFALRYRERTAALILLVPRTYDPTDAVGVNDQLSSRAVLWLVGHSADFLFWLAMRVARGAVVRFLGVPLRLEASATKEERARVTEVIRSVLPLSRRARGIATDSLATVGPWPLERIAVPTLIVTARDDLFQTLPGSRFTAEHLPGSELRILERGGHLMVGQADRVKGWIRDFLQRSRDLTSMEQAV